MDIMLLMVLAAAAAAAATVSVAHLIITACGVLYCTTRIFSIIVKIILFYFQTKTIAYSNIYYNIVQYTIDVVKIDIR